MHLECSPHGSFVSPFSPLSLDHFLLSLSVQFALFSLPVCPLCRLCLPRRRPLRWWLPVLVTMVFVEVDGDVGELTVLQLENICKATISPHIPLHKSAPEMAA